MNSFRFRSALMFLAADRAMVFNSSLFMMSVLLNVELRIDSYTV